MAPPARVQNGQRRGTAPPALPPIPFTAAAHKHTEPVVQDTSLALGAAQQPRGPFDVPAYGFLRHIFLEVVGSGGTLGAGVLHPDYPFNILQNISLVDVNGAPIYGPLDGYATLWANIIGGYSFRGDPRLLPWHVATINCAFGLRIPVEISAHNAYGALANQNAAASYKLSWTLNTSTATFTTAPTTPPNVLVRAWLEAWSQPNQTDLTGRPQQRAPIGHGTTQFWSAFTKAGLAVGQNTVLLPRVGNLIRNVVFIARSTAANTPRDDTVFPNDIGLNWDARSLHSESQRHHIAQLSEALSDGAVRDTGVFSYSFDNSILGKAGDEEPNLWLPTVQATRLELVGASATAGSIQVITNDIAPVEVRPDERFVENSATGFHPNIGQPVPVSA
jgi:hypothetical protein